MAENLLEQLKALLKQKRNNEWYAQRLGISVDEVKELRAELKGQIYLEDRGFGDPPETEIIGQDTDHETGDTILTAQSPRPLSPKEIEQLAQVDNITTY